MMRKTLKPRLAWNRKVNQRVDHCANESAEVMEL